VKGMNLNDRIALITGAARGIGRGIALHFVRCGAQVAVVDLNGEGAAATVEEIRRMGGQGIAIRADVTQRDEVERMVGQTMAEWGRIDILVNNVGWDCPMPFLKKPAQLCDRIIDVNLKSTIICSRAVMEPMMARRSGKIVNIASDAGRLGLNNLTVYSAAKAGVIAFTKALARELAPYRINVNCIAPGVIDTPLLQEIMTTSDEEALKSIKALDRGIPWKRRGTPEDIAKAVAFLCSDDADYITGQVLSVNGGAAMVD